MQRIAYGKVSPEAVKALMGVKAVNDKGSIDAKLRALVDLRVSQINGCLFCVDMHSNEARHAGETQQRLDCLPVWRESSFFSARERAALSWAESLTRVSETGVPDEEYARAREQFNEKELVDLTMVVGMINFWNRISISFRSEPPVRSAPTDKG